MSFWAGIKHALNSTLGTSNFKPLDEMVDMRMYKSPNIFVDLGNRGKVEDMGEPTTHLPALSTGLRWRKRITFGISGNCNIEMQLSNDKYVCKIYKNSHMIINDPKTTSANRTYDISCSENDHIIIEITPSTNLNVSVTNMYLKCSLAPKNFILDE